MFRIIQQTQPTWVIGENVANFLNMAFTRTKTDLESIGYNVQPFVIPACAVGAPHRRDRVWIVAYSGNKRCGSGSGDREKRQILHHENGAAEKDQPEREGWQCGVGTAGSVDTGLKTHTYADTDSTGLERGIKWSKERLQSPDNVFAPFWDRDKNELPQSYTYRGHDGFPGRVDRLRALGNAVVPQIPEIIGRAIMAVEKENEND